MQLGQLKAQLEKQLHSKLPVPSALHSEYNPCISPALPYNEFMVFIETKLFTKLLPDYLSDDEYRGLQSYLLQKPDTGNLVKGSGGVRKVRWAKPGKGKSGGLRVIYYWKKSNHEIWMLTL